MYSFNSKFKIGDKVCIDSAADITGTITGLIWYEHRMEYEVAWFSSGNLVSHWIKESRLSLVES